LAQKDVVPDGPDDVRKVLPCPGRAPGGVDPAVHRQTQAVAARAPLDVLAEETADQPDDHPEATEQEETSDKERNHRIEEHGHLSLPSLSCVLVNILQARSE
jgi:hypothetical protein